MADSKDIIVWDGREWQRTGGKYYILRTDYKHRTGEMLHRAIWKKYFGEIPEGYVIHHIDHNPDNNDISNLECISNREHCQRHMREPERIAKSKETLKNITIPKLEEWRKSEEGQKRLKEYGDRLAKQYIDNLVDAVCTRCGQPFKMHPTRGTGLCRKCGKYMASKRYEEKKKAERQANPCYVEVACTECGKVYRTNINTRNKDGLCKNCAERKRYREKQQAKGLQS